MEDYTDYKLMGDYVGGHPLLNNTVNNILAREDEQEIGLYKSLSLFESPTRIASIPINAISNIQISDATTIENKITLGRVLLVGVFALAWRKKKKIEHTFLIVTWKNGKFDNDTIFSFEGKNAMQKTNIARNELIQMCKE